MYSDIFDCFYFLLTFGKWTFILLLKPNFFRASSILVATIRDVKMYILPCAAELAYCVLTYLMEFLQVGVSSVNECWMQLYTTALSRSCKMSQGTYSS